MATVYSSERAKYGNLTGQIIIWPVQINPDINAPATPEKILMSINKLKKKYEK